MHTGLCRFFFGLCLMKKVLISACLFLSLSALSGCDQHPDKDAIINTQAQQIAALQQQTCAPPAVQSTAAGVPVAQAASPQIVTSAPAPVIVQQPTVVHDSNDGLLTGMMLGHMLSGGGGGGGSSSNHTTTHIVNNYHAPAPVASPAPARRSWYSGSTASSGSTYRRSSFSSGARSSFYSSRSSFRSGRR
jgi:hypothetical protein